MGSVMKETRLIAVAAMKSRLPFGIVNSTSRPVVRSIPLPESTGEIVSGPEVPTKVQNELRLVALHVEGGGTNHRSVDAQLVEPELQLVKAQVGQPIERFGVELLELGVGHIKPGCSAIGMENAAEVLATPVS